MTQPYNEKTTILIHDFVFDTKMYLNKAKTFFEAIEKTDAKLEDPFFQEAKMLFNSFARFEQECLKHGVNLENYYFAIDMYRQKHQNKQKDDTGKN